MNMVQRLFSAVGRPRNVEGGEVMVVANDMLASMTNPKDGGVYFLPVDEIIARKGWKVYREMLNDDQVKTCLEFKKTLIAGRTFEFSPGDTSPEAAIQADFIEDAMKRVDVKKALRDSLTALEFGFSLAELVFEREDWNGKTMVMVKKIAHRDPTTIELKMDKHGNFLGARQQNTFGGGYIELTPEKLWLFSHDKRFGNIYGNSDLRAAYRAWYAKKFIIQFWNVFMERMGAPMTKVSYPEGASEALKNTLKKILNNLASKTEILVPQGVEIELIEATRGGNAGYTEALAFHNSSIARAILMVALLGAEGGSTDGNASDSQSYLHLRILFKMADELSQLLSQSLMEQIVKQLIDLNFPNPIYPKFILQDYGQFEGMKVADEIRQLHAAGIIDMDQKDVNYCRSIMGLPLRDVDDEPDAVIRPTTMPPVANSTSTPPAADQGNSRADKGGSATGDSTGTPAKPASGDKTQ